MYCLAFIPIDSQFEILQYKLVVMDIGSKGLKCIQYFKTNYLSSSARFPKFFVAQLILKLIRLLVFFVSMRRQPGINISMRKTLMLEHRHRDPKHLFVRQIWPSHDSQALSEVTTIFNYGSQMIS